MRRLTNGDTHKFTLSNSTGQRLNSSYGYFPNVRCEAVMKTINAYLNSIKKEGENMTMPRLEVNLNEYNVSFGIDTFLFDRPG